jgi:hypothetical protein
MMLIPFHKNPFAESYVIMRDIGKMLNLSFLITKGIWLNGPKNLRRAKEFG